MTVLALVCSLTPASLAQGAELNTVPAEAAAEAVPEAETVIIAPVGTYNEGRIRVTDGTLWGYADNGGQIVIPIRFEAVEDFSLGCAKVTLEGKVGLLHYNGSFLLDPEYDELTHVGYGVYLARQGELWSLLSINAFQSEAGLTHTLYSDLTSVSLSTGVPSWLTMKGIDGTTTRITVNSLPQLLSELRVPGWQFPLSTRQANFRDVSGQVWYDVWVDLAFSTGLMNGIGNNTFDPLRALTVSEALHLAACLESRALQDDFHLQSHSDAVWYSSSVTYCEAVGLITPGQFSQSDYERPITRAEMAKVFSATTAVRSIVPRNDPSRVKDSIPDVKSDDFAADAIYDLYAKGILAGIDNRLSFGPDSSLIRAEAAAVVARIARPEHRITIWEPIT